MAGPQNPQAAGPDARGGQYVTTPGFASPGQSTPSHSRTAPESTVVYSPKGWRWEEAGDDYSLAVSKMTSSAIESAVRRMRTSFGQVYYIKGTATAQPPFAGEAVGDTCRVQDAVTLEIVAEWRWDGRVWERMQIDNQQISNLDVGKLTAGSAAINEIAARRIASDVGRFLELTTDQLTVTGNASFTDVVARNIWTRVMTAQIGEFEQIRAGMLAANSVSADTVQAGAIDGQVITGATIQTSKARGRGIKIDDYGIRAYRDNGIPSVSINAYTGHVTIDGTLGISDTWSSAWFTDIVSTQTQADVDNWGGRWGVGISMNKLASAYTYPALMTFREDPQFNGGMLYLQAPSNAVGKSPNLRLGAGGLYGYGGAASPWNLSIHTGGYNIGSPGQSNIFGSTTLFAVSINNKQMVYSHPDQFGLHTHKWDETGVWGNASNTVLGYGKGKQAVVDRNGFRGVGGKNFIMRVPGEWKKRRMMLQHASTESPYDGIEYWEYVTLDSEGRGSWKLPDYVPKIASPEAPWIAFTSSSATAAITKTGFGVDAPPWTVEVTGQPGEKVGVLVKGARQLDEWDPETDEVELRDRTLDSPWQLPPVGPSDDISGTLEEGWADYGPAPKPAQHNEEEQS